VAVDQDFVVETRKFEPDHAPTPTPRVVAKNALEIHLKKGDAQV